MYHVDRHGFTVIPSLFAMQAGELVGALSAVLETPSDATSIRSRAGNVYAARNIVALWPDAATVWREPALVDALTAVLGPGFGLVRTLFFDKPPEQTWSLPWHQDTVIAVRDNRLPSPHFTHPTRKAGVPHVEAPRWLLENMLIARIHLDEVTDENGPLQVIPGSHVDGEGSGAAEPVSILVRRGDVLLMRPLLLHGSPASKPLARFHSGSGARILIVIVILIVIERCERSARLGAFDYD